MLSSPHAGEPLAGRGDPPTATAAPGGAFGEGAARGLGQDEVS